MDFWHYLVLSDFADDLEDDLDLLEWCIDRGDYDVGTLREYVRKHRQYNRVMAKLGYY